MRFVKKKGEDSVPEREREKMSRIYRASLKRKRVRGIWYYAYRRIAAPPATTRASTVEGRKSPRAELSFVDELEGPVPELAVDGVVLPAEAEVEPLAELVAEEEVAEVVACT